MATSFTNKLYDINDKNTPTRFLQATSKIYNFMGLSLVDHTGLMTAAQITAALDQWVNARASLPPALPVVEVTVVTV